MISSVIGKKSFKELVIQMNEIKKIVYIIDQVGSNMAGTEKQLINMINGLNKERFKIYLICFRKHPWFEKNARFLKCDSTVIKINKITRRSTYINFLKLIQYLRNIRPDIVHTFFPVGNIAGVLAARLAGVKNIISSRRDNGEWINPMYLFATNIANRYVKKIVTNSYEVKKYTEKVEKNCSGKVEVIANGIDVDLFKNIKICYDLKQKLNIPQNNKIVGILANFRPMKHHQTFIQSANEILKIRDDVNFVLIGFGFTPWEEEIKKMVNTLGIDHKLHFVGAQKEVVPFLSIMDVGVNCSEMEGLSNAIMEYMAAGIPCVVSNSGGNPDLITHNINGYTFELDDYKTLANLTLRLLDDKETRERFINNSLEKVKKEMRLEHIILKYESFYGVIT